MKVSIVTGFTPTEENKRGISGLIYSILKYRPKNVDVKIFTYNFNKIERTEMKELENELYADIIEIRKPKWVKVFDNVWGGRFAKFFIKRPIVCDLLTDSLITQLCMEDPDLIWVYPYFFYRLAEKFPLKQVVVSGCDCEALIRVRNFDSRACLMNNKALRHNYLMLKKGLWFESEWNRPNIKVHFVGMEDYLFYKQTYGYENSHFLLHPHYALVEKWIDFSHCKLKVIIAGSYDIYMQDDIDRMIPNLLRNKKVLSKNFVFTFLGKNWEKIKQVFADSGFNCEVKSWVDNYAEELVQNDIQLSPISYGTGTKGKVLSALANGLLVVGSAYAFENICVRHNDSCVRYRNASEIASILITIARQKERYQKIAVKGRSQVREYHNPQRISKRFFDIYGKDCL